MRRVVSPWLRECWFDALAERLELEGLSPGEVERLMAEHQDELERACWKRKTVRLARELAARWRQAA